MRWDEVENVEMVLETIWDLHDRISDAIHAISRSHFLKSIKTLAGKASPYANIPPPVGVGGNGGDGRRRGFVFVKEFRVDDDAAMKEARSLNAIRTALENLEDQLEFFRTVQLQQRAERDSALSSLTQSRIILALRLTDHQGKRYEVIEEALKFVSDIHDEGRFVAPENLYEMPGSQPGENIDDDDCGAMSTSVMRMLVSGFELSKNSLKWEKMGGVLGNAALFAVSMLALLQLHQVAFATSRFSDQDSSKKRIDKVDPRLVFSSQMKNFDVFSARG